MKLVWQMYSKIIMFNKLKLNETQKWLALHTIIYWTDRPRTRRVFTISAINSWFVAMLFYVCYPMLMIYDLRLPQFYLRTYTFIGFCTYSDDKINVPRWLWMYSDLRWNTLLLEEKRLSIFAIWRFYLLIYLC